MLKNYLVTILRHIQKNKVFSFINIFGLALGMAACLVIAQYVNFHTSFDGFHSNASKIFRIEGEAFKNGASIGTSVSSPDLLSLTLSEQSPVVEKSVRFFDYNYANNTIIYKDSDNQVNFDQGNVYISDASLFEIFDLPFTAGNANKFDEPQKAILTKSASLKYFNNPEKAIGRSFTLSGNNGGHEYELIGVIDDLPQNSHFNFELLLSYPSLENYSNAGNSWTNSSMVSYILLDDEKNSSMALEEINRLYEANIKDAIAQSGYAVNFYLKPLQEIHLDSNSWSFKSGVDKKTIFILSIIAIVILVIAWINYMNLSLIRTIERLKEMGIRKCMGSSMKQITQLFILEAFVMNLFAFFGTLLLTQFGEKYLLEATGLPISALMNMEVFFLLGGLIIIGTFLIGLYPYVLLKTVKTVNILVGQKGKVGGTKMRKSLVFVQFVITFILIAGTITVYNQINYMRDADLGISIENILVIKSPPGDVGSSDREDVARFSTLKTELLKNSGIAEITNAGEIPGEAVSWRAGLYLKNEGKEASVSTGLISMDTDFPAFFDIDLVAGRSLRKGDDPWSKGDVVINVKLAQQLGFADPEDAIGAEIDGFYGPTLNVRGVLENHHHTSLHDDYMPIAFIVSSWTEFYFVKLKLNDKINDTRSDQLAGLVSTIRGEWNNVFTDFQMDYFFLDRAFDEQYKEDIRFGKIFSGFSSLAILIACLGLFGLTSFTIQQRTKEIGIRKVLGATAENLVFLLSKEYLVLVAVACILSVPVAWWIMSQWLEGYTFRIDLGWWFFIIPVVFVLTLALLSIITKVIGTVRKNPVESLRYE